MLICNKKNALRLIISTTLFSVPLMTNAADHHDDHDGHDHSEHSEHSEHRQHSAHVHGVVETNIAVGFEYAPKNKEQEQLLEQAIAKLKEPATIFSLSASANCTVSDIHVSHNMKSEDHDDHDHDHDHHDDDSHHEEHQGEHGEFTAQYEYHCEKMPELNQIETQWFTVFSHTQKMTVQYLGDSGQKAATLTAKKAVLAL